MRAAPGPTRWAISPKAASPVAAVSGRAATAIAAVVARAARGGEGINSDILGALRMMLARPRVTLPVRLVTEARTIPAAMASDVSPAWIYHHPAEVLDYAIDWSDWLEALDSDDDAVVSAVWSAPADLEIGDSGFVAPQAVIWIGGGRSHQRYRVDCTLTTQRGRSAVRSLHLYGRAS